MLRRRSRSRKRAVSLSTNQRPWHRAVRVLLIIAIIANILPIPVHDVIANGTPVVALSFTGSESNQPLIGENYSFTATFQNTSPVDPGFGPYVDLLFPVNGIDGNHGSSTADGTDFLSATYLGTTVVATQLTFPAGATTTGCVTHPYAKNSSNQSIQYCGTTGDKLVVLQLPFGSFSPGQPAVDITVNSSLSNLADANAPLTLQARAGFRYGNDPLDNATTDPSIISSLVNTVITPTILRIRKTYNGPENEIATGPNDPKSYTVSVDLPTGMNVTNLDLSDDIPMNMQYVSVSGQSPGGSSITLEPSTSTPSGPPTNRVTVDWLSVTGTGSSSDASYNVNFYIPLLDASSTDVIAPSTGSPVTSIDDISAQANWTPIDVRDAPSLVTSNASASDHTLNDTTLAAQKSGAIAVDTGPAGLTPGDTIEYTVVFQISDFFALTNVHSTDTMSDGQLFDGTFTPTLSYTRDGVTTTGTIGLANFSTVHDTPGTGQTYLDISISDELSDRGHADGGDLLGGCVPSGGGVSDCTFHNGGLTTGIIKYRTVVQTAYTDDFPSGHPNVDQGDPITNSILLKGSILNTTTLVATGSDVSNGSSENLNIITGTLTQKTIYAVNGNTSFTSPVHIAPGDSVTYRLQITQPTSNLDSFHVTDYLPLPIFTATSVTSFSAVVSAAVPAIGAAKFGPNDTFYASNGIAPTLTSSAVENSVTFDYGNSIVPTTPPGQYATVADILFTVEASNNPFTDGLFLTNQAQATQGDTTTDTDVSTQIVQIILNEPNLTMTKGAVTSDSTTALFAPTTVGPVTFQSPSGTCPAFSGMVSSTGLTAHPIGSNVSRIDRGDQVKFAMVIENTGNSSQGAFDVKVKDVLPSGMDASSTGIHLCVTRGDGVAIPYTDLGGGLFGSGIELNDASSTQGSIYGFGVASTTGQNIAVITYDLTSNGTTLPGASTTNTATLFNYAGDEAGPDFTSIDQTDSVSVTTKLPTITKSILGTSATSSFSNDVVIGETVQYQVSVSIPEATSTSVTLVDALPTGMVVYSLDSLTASSSVDTTAGGGFAGALAAAVISNSGRTTTITLGTITNTDTNNSATETVEFIVTAIVTNVSGNQASNTRINQGTWNWTGSSVSANAPTVTIREPVLTLSKTASPSIVSGGETTTFTLTVANASGSTNQPAFDVDLQDLLPTNLGYVTGTLMNVSGNAATLDDSSSTHLTASWGFFATGTNSVITFQATAAVNATPSSTLTNTANVRWTTLQGNQSASSSPYAAGGCERSGDPTQVCGTTVNDNSVTTTRSILIGAPTVSKVLLSTSATSTSGTSVAIGEILTYQVTIGLPDGTESTGTTLTDTLPTNGLAIVDLTSITASGTLATTHAGGFAGVLADATTTSNGAALSFPFDDITNSDSVTTTQETIVVVYRAVVLNTTANLKGVTRRNTASWNWLANAVTSTSGNVTIVEPVITNTLAASTSTGDAGDTVTYTVTIAHAATSTSDAFDLSLAELLPADMTYVPGSLINFSGTAATLDDSSSTNLIATWSALGTASSSVLQFQATAATTTAPGQSIVTTSTITFSSVQGDVTAAQSVYNASSCERTGNTSQACGTTANTYTVTSAKAFSVAAPFSVKSLIATSAPHTSGTSTAIGETATFSFDVTLPEGTAPSLTLSDVLPTGLQYVTSSVSVSSTSFNGTLPSFGVSTVGGNGDDVDVTFGSIVTNADNVTTNNTFTITLQVLILNVAGNSVGALLDDFATVTAGSSSSTSNHLALKIVEPDLQTVKTADISTPAFGETVLFTLTSSHSGTSNADAFEPVITDLIPSGMAYTLGSAILPAGWSVNETGNPTIIFSATQFPFASSSAIITYQAVASSPSGTSLGAILTNYATTTWTSLSGVDANERTGTGGVNDYFHNASKAVTVSGPDIFISKTDSGASVAPSGTVSYAVTYGNQGNAADSGVVLHETVPTGTLFNAGASTPGWSCANASPAGTACNLSIGVLGAGASSTITYAVTALNPAASGLNSLSNTATITDAGTSTDPTPGDESTNDTTPLNAVPDLTITKTDSATSTLPGNVVAYTLAYSNIGNQDASGVTISETVPANTTFYTASSSVGWTGCSNGSASGTVCTYTVGALAGGGAVSGTVTYAVLVDYPLLSFTASLDNTATIDDDGTNGTDSDLSNNTATDTDAIIQEGPEYAVTIDDGVTSIQPGQSVTLTYTIANNGNVNGTGVVVTSTLSSYLIIGAISNGGFVTTTASGTEMIIWPTFALAGGGTSVIRTVVVTLDDDVPTSATSTTATADVQDDGLNGAEVFFPNNTDSDTDSVVFPPTGGGGGGPPPPPPVTTYQTITYLDGKVIVPLSIVTPATPPPAPSCTVTCADTTYDLSITNPDGSERRASSGYAQIEKISATKSLYRFEDRGADFDYNDVLIEVDKSSCLQPVFTVKTVNARWHHQIKADILVRGILKDRMTLWTDSHAAIGASRLVDAASDANLCKVPSCKLDSCAGVGYQIYIVNPNGVARESGTRFVRAKSIGAHLVQYGFEDKGDDFDYNDVIVNVDDADCSNIQITATPLSANWHHQIRLRLLKDGKIKDDLRLWNDSHDAPGNVRAVNAMTDERMCTETPISVEQSGVTLFEHINYGGKSVTILAGKSSPDLSTSKFSKIVSSVRVFGDSAATLFRDKLYKGVSEYLIYSDADLRNNVIGQDTAQSLKVERWGTQSPATLKSILGVAPPTTSQAQQSGVCKASPPFTRDMAPGDTSADVTRLQNLMKCLGNISQSIVSTGHYGPATISAVRIFQAENGIPQTGSVGPQTRAALNAL